MASYSERLNDQIRSKKTPALIGLDPRWELLPQSIRDAATAAGGTLHEVQARAFEHFCTEIIDVIAPLVPAVKPQSAFFEACGPAGVWALQRVIRVARERGLIVICDAKRGDIGSTAQAYAEAYLAGEDPDCAPFGADSLTVNPYMGVDTLQPFLERCRTVNAGLYVLVRTSNPGSGDFQNRKTSETALFEAVADHVEQLAGEAIGNAPYGDIGAVVGATYPEELSALRVRMPHCPLLVPGYGSQGGTAADVAGAFDAGGLGALVNSSRGVIFSYTRQPYLEEFGETDWVGAVEAATIHMINDLATHTAAKSLRKDRSH